MSGVLDTLAQSGNGIPVNLTGTVANALATTLPTEQRFSYTFTSLASVTIVKSAAGFLHSVLVGSPSTATTVLYDRASGASGAVIASFNANTPVGNYLIDVSFLNGLTINVDIGLAPQVTLSYR